MLAGIIGQRNKLRKCKWNSCFIILSSMCINPFVLNAPPKTIKKPLTFVIISGVEKQCIGNKWVKLWAKHFKEKIGRVLILSVFFSISIIIYQLCTTVPQGTLAFEFCIDNSRNGFSYSLQLHDLSWLYFPGNFSTIVRMAFIAASLGLASFPINWYFLIDLKNTFIRTGRNGNCPITIEAFLAWHFLYFLWNVNLKNSW